MSRITRLHRPNGNSTESSSRPIVCAICKRANGTLVKVGDDYRHSMCQPHSEPTSGEIPNLPLHRRPKLWVAQVRPPELTKLHA